MAQPGEVFRVIAVATTTTSGANLWDIRANLSKQNFTTRRLEHAHQQIITAASIGLRAIMIPESTSGSTGRTETGKLPEPHTLDLVMVAVGATCYIKLLALANAQTCLRHFLRL